MDAGRGFERPWFTSTVASSHSSTSGRRSTVSSSGTLKVSKSSSPYKRASKAGHPVTTGRKTGSRFGLKQSVPGAAKSRPFTPFEDRRPIDRGDLNGPPVPRLATAIYASKGHSLAARKAPLDIPQGEPVGGRYYINGGALKRVESDEESLVEDDDAQWPSGAPSKAARKLELPSPFARKTGVPSRLAARKIDPIYISSDDEDEDEQSAPDSEEDDYSDLLAAFEPLSITTRLRLHKSLPFLMRNLRKGFLVKCATIGIPTAPKDVPNPSMQIIYRYLIHDDSDHPLEDDWEEVAGESTEWVCPICDLHGAMATREMVEYHLQNDHDEVQATWTQQADARWKVTVTYKRTRDEQQVDVDTDEYFASSALDLNLPSAPPNPASGSTRVMAAATVGTLREPLPTGRAAELEAPVIRIKHMQKQDEDVEILGRNEKTVIDPLCSGLTENGKLIPPPKDKSLGPAAQYPFLRGDMISCRPGGPRLFDLLNELELDEFGILSWSIIDREEEIFELEDIRDEDKVILALWNRWIMLNRVKFVFQGYLRGVQSFIDKYYEMIHRAAGWNSLRMFLLMLKANRFLTLGEVKLALDHYEEKIGMKDWYKETHRAKPEPIP